MVHAIVSFKGTTIDESFLDLIAHYKPLGVILMASNVAGLEPQAIKKMTDTLRQHVLHIVIDQEGGKVRRLQGPAFYQGPATIREIVDSATVDEAAQKVYTHASMIGRDLKACGIDVNCAPCLDLFEPHFLQQEPPHVITGYGRAFSQDPLVVTALGIAYCQGLLDAGIVPVIKHMPGHGRSVGADSHQGKCYVKQTKAALQAEDFLPFQKVHALLGDQIWGMTAHACYDAIDPEVPGTLSRHVIECIRQTIGFKGKLMTDALEMGALDPLSMAERVGQAVDAGCDAMLYCGGDFETTKHIFEYLLLWQHKFAS